jgi:hypothetical protein
MHVPRPTQTVALPVCSWADQPLLAKRSIERGTLNSMPRRVHLALGLVLLLVLAPLARVTCGIGCLGTISHPPALLATSQPDCVRATPCCDSSRPAFCTATQASESLATLLSTDANATPEAPAFAAVTAQSPLQKSGIPVAQSIASSPPGQLPASPIPLRI